MADLISSLSQSAAAMEAQSRRLRHLSENVANADTPGYRRKTIPFELEATGSGVSTVEAGRVRLDRSDLERIDDPAHPLADETGHYQGSNVDLIIEIADAREAQRSYEANLKMFTQAREMSSGLMDLLRR